MRWLNARNFSAANFRSANWVLKNRATSAPTLNAPKMSAFCQSGEPEARDVVEPELEPRPPDEELQEHHHGTVGSGRRSVAGGEVALSDAMRRDSGRG